jgi:hypothetical protein
MGLFKMLFGGAKAPDLQPGAWLVGLREAVWAPVLDQASQPSSLALCTLSCVRENGNDFFVLRQSLANSDQLMYMGCVRLSGAKEVMVLVERQESPDQSSEEGDFWSYERVLTVKDTPALPQLFQQLASITSQRTYAAKPAYLEHLVKGLEAMTG